MTKTAIYCLRCKKYTDTLNVERELNKRGLPYIVGDCDVCGQKKFKLLPKDLQGDGIYEFLSKTVGKLTGEKGLTVWGSNYCGPFNSISEDYQRRNPPTNRVDSICLAHDLDYNEADKFKETDKAKYGEMMRAADQKMLNSLSNLQNMTVGERLLKGVAGTAIGAKSLLDKVTGNGIKKKK